MLKYGLFILSCCFCFGVKAGLILKDAGNPDKTFVFKEGATSSTVKWQWVNGNPDIYSLGIFIGTDIDGSARGKYLELLMRPDGERSTTFNFSDDLAHFTSPIDEEFVVGSNHAIEFFIRKDNQFWYSSFNRNPGQEDVWDLQWINDNKLMATLFENDLGLDTFRLTIDNVSRFVANDNNNGNDPIAVSEPPLLMLFALAIVALIFNRKREAIKSTNMTL